MENIYNDEVMPQNYEQIAKAYSKSLKNKGFVFVRLEEEEFNLLLSEVHVILSKMQACLKRMKTLDSAVLNGKICASRQALEEKFGPHKMHQFKYVENENQAFLTLVSLENLLIIKLMLLSVKSGELELCNQISTSIAGIFAESFSTEGFRMKNRAVDAISD